VLDSARLDAGRLKLRRAWTPSVEIVTEAERAGRSIVEGQDVTIDTRIQPGLPPVFVDRARIVQAVVATFRHAVRDGRAGTIALRAREDRGRDGRACLRLEVENASRPLHPDDLARAFDAFGDLRESTGRRMGGLGLALALARKLARLHGGDAWAEAASAGTRYVVAIPLEPPADADRTGPQRATGATLGSAR
jgi:signal transduction histidine kinase